MHKMNEESIFVWYIWWHNYRITDANYWNTHAKSTLQNALNLQHNQGVAKNVIYFVGDGMDIITTTAARILRGQLDGQTGEEGTLAWEDFPNVALSKVSISMLYNRCFSIRIIYVLYCV